MKKVTVVIPNLNGMKYLGDCLLSLRRQSMQNFDIILLDNGSTDGSVAYVRQHFPEVRVRAYRENTGFCHAVNDGILLARTPYVLLLNNDTVCGREMLRALLDACEEGGDQVFSCCAKLISLREPDRLDDAGDYFCALGWAFARGKGKSARLYSRQEECFACCAAAALYRREVFDRIGLFDEKHFAYLEDMDIGWRAKAAGYRNLYVPAAHVLHAGSATSGSRYNDFKVRQASGNNLYMIVKNMPSWQLALNAPSLAAGILIKAVWFAKKGFGRAYLSGLGRGLSMIRGIRAGDGPVCTSGMSERRSAAGMSERPVWKKSVRSCMRIQLDMLKGLILLAETWR